MDVEEQQQQQQNEWNPLESRIVRVQAVDTNGRFYPMRCVVSGVETDRCEREYQIFVHDRAKLILFAEWVSETDHSHKSYAGATAGFNRWDTFTVHHLKDDLLRLMNGDSQYDIVQYGAEMLGRIVTQHRLYQDYFYNETLRNRMRDYENRVLIGMAQTAPVNDRIIRTLLDNNKAAVEKIRLASVVREAWMLHLRDFIAYWRPEVERLSGPVL
jgi:hypothetical protein